MWVFRRGAVSFSQVTQSWTAVTELIMTELTPNAQGYTRAARVRIMPGTTLVFSTSVTAMALVVAVPSILACKAQLSESAVLKTDSQLQH